MTQRRSLPPYWSAPRAGRLVNPIQSEIVFVQRNPATGKTPTRDLARHHSSADRYEIGMHDVGIAKMNLLCKAGRAPPARKFSRA